MVTNETVTLSGNAKVETAQGWMTGEPIIWDRANNTMHATNETMVLRQIVSGVLANTNPPAVNTNGPAAPK
jgi:lipopolysaccharide export system protein LptA